MPIGTEGQIRSSASRFARHDEGVSTGMVATFDEGNPRPGNSPLGTTIDCLKLSVVQLVHCFSIAERRCSDIGIWERLERHRFASSRTYLV